MKLKPAVFLDRDGTIIVERHYLSNPNDVALEDRVVESLCCLAAAGYALVVLTNQSGIARGLLTYDQAIAVNGRIDMLLAEHNISIAGWYICPHEPSDRCSCRKPLPGLALRAARDIGLDLAESWIIGDKRSDLEVGDHIGARGILVTTGHGKSSAAWAKKEDRYVVPTLNVAVPIILSK